MGEELVFPKCGDTMVEIGTEVVWTLEIIPARTIVREDIYYAYARQTCDKENNEALIVKASR